MYFIDKLIELGCSYEDKGTYYLSALLNFVTKEKHQTLDELYSAVAETYGVRPAQVKGAINWMLRKRNITTLTTKRFVYKLIAEYKEEINPEC